jgi:hypothetical protein
MVALAYWGGFGKQRMSEVAGFDMSPFNRLERVPQKLSVGLADLSLRGAAASCSISISPPAGPISGARRASSSSLEAGRSTASSSGYAFSWIPRRNMKIGPAPGSASTGRLLFYPLDELRSKLNRATRFGSRPPTHVMTCASGKKTDRTAAA